MKQAKPHAVTALCLATLLAVYGGGCAQDCTLIGGINGVAVTIPTALYLKDGSVTIEVCDDADCGSTVKEFGKLPGNAGAEERAFTATFSDLGQEFDPGSVGVRVELLDVSGATVAVREANVELSRYFPNGEQCDGDGYVSGSLQLQSGDAV